LTKKYIISIPIFWDQEGTRSRRCDTSHLICKFITEFGTVQKLQQAMLDNKISFWCIWSHSQIL